MSFVAPRNPDRFEGEYRHDSGGRLAERHRNSYPMAPEPIDAWRRIQDAADCLINWADQEGDLPSEALEDMVRAWELLNDAHWHVPRVYGYVVRYKIRFGSMTTDHYSDFSAHESMVEAIRWAMEWERKLPHGENGDGSTGPWEIAWAPARVNMFRAFGTDPSDFIRKL
jgi:hypothetical protein